MSTTELWCRLTNTLSRGSVPVAVELANATGYPCPFISSVTEVFACGTIVIAIRGAGEVTVQRRKQSWASSDYKDKIMGIKKCNLLSYNAVPVQLYIVLKLISTLPSTRMINLQAALFLAWSYTLYRIMFAPSLKSVPGSWPTNITLQR